MVLVVVVVGVPSYVNTVNLTKLPSIAPSIDATNHHFHPWPDKSSSPCLPSRCSRASSSCNRRSDAPIVASLDIQMEELAGTIAPSSTWVFESTVLPVTTKAHAGAMQHQVKASNASKPPGIRKIARVMATTKAISTYETFLTYGPLALGRVWRRTARRIPIARAHSPPPVGNAGSTPGSPARGPRQ